jgi:hypothetical protein
MAEYIALKEGLPLPAFGIALAVSSPAVTTRQSTDIVEFVVDTLGNPNPRTFKAVRVADSALVKQAEMNLGRWHFSPAVATGCKVPQEVVPRCGGESFPPSRARVSPCFSARSDASGRASLDIALIGMRTYPAAEIAR